MTSGSFTNMAAGNAGWGFVDKKKSKKSKNSFGGALMTSGGFPLMAQTRVKTTLFSIILDWGRNRNFKKFQ